MIRSGRHAALQSVPMGWWASFGMRYAPRAVHVMGKTYQWQPHVRGALRLCAASIDAAGDVEAKLHAARHGGPRMTRDRPGNARQRHANAVCGAIVAAGAHKHDVRSWQSYMRSSSYHAIGRTYGRQERLPSGEQVMDDTLNALQCRAASGPVRVFCVGGSVSVAQTAACGAWHHRQCARRDTSHASRCKEAR